MKILTGEIDERQWNLIAERFNRISSTHLPVDKTISTLTMMMLDVRTLLAAFDAKEDLSTKAPK